MEWHRLLPVVAALHIVNCGATHKQQQQPPALQPAIIQLQLQMITDAPQPQVLLYHKKRKLKY